MPPTTEGNFKETGTTVIGTVITAVGQNLNFDMGRTNPYKCLMVYNQGPAPLTNFTVLVSDQNRTRYATLDGTSFQTLGSALFAKAEYCTANKYFTLQAAVASGSVATLNTYWII